MLDRCIHQTKLGNWLASKTFYCISWKVAHEKQIQSFSLSQLYMYSGYSRTVSSHLALLAAAHQKHNTEDLGLLGLLGHERRDRSVGGACVRCSIMNLGRCDLAGIHI